MAQILYVKKPVKDKDTGQYIKDKNGNIVNEELKMNIIRSWSTDKGVQLFLHANGVYGYKDGSPVKDRGELDNPELIGDPVQMKMALAWWKRKGEKLSREFYEKKEEMLEKLAETSATEDVSDLDTVLYMRRPMKNRRWGAYGDPSTWFEFFEERPPWWGVVESCTAGDWYYKQVDPETMKRKRPDPEEDEKDEKEPGDQKKSSATA